VILNLDYTSSVITNKKAGWNPIGTSLENNDTWDKQDYESHSGQLVAKELNVGIAEIEMCLFAYAEEIAKNSFKK